MTLEQTTILRQFAKLSVSLAFIVLFSLALFSVPTAVLAHTDPADPNHTHPPGTTGSVVCPTGKICNPVKAASINEFLNDILKVVVQYGLILIVFFLVLAGFKFVVAQGNPEKISEARKMLVWVIVGAFVLLGVYVIKAAVCGTIDKISADPTKKACE